MRRAVALACAALIASCGLARRHPYPVAMGAMAAITSIAVGGPLATDCQGDDRAGCTAGDHARTFAIWAGVGLALGALLAPALRPDRVEPPPRTPAWFYLTATPALAGAGDARAGSARRATPIAACVAAKHDLARADQVRCLSSRAARVVAGDVLATPCRCKPYRGAYLCRTTSHARCTDAAARFETLGAAVGTTRAVTEAAARADAITGCAAQGGAAQPGAVACVCARELGAPGGDCGCVAEATCVR